MAAELVEVLDGKLQGPFRSVQQGLGEHLFEQALDGGLVVSTRAVPRGLVVHVACASYVLPAAPLLGGSRQGQQLNSETLFAGSLENQCLGSFAVCFPARGQEIRQLLCP